MAENGREWPGLDVNGREWPEMDGNDREWPTKAGNLREWPGMTENGWNTNRTLLKPYIKTPYDPLESPYISQTSYKSKASLGRDGKNKVAELFRYFTLLS